jgi:two-component system sensor histidine kinase EvgS
VLGLLEQAQRRAAAGIADPAPLAIARRSALGLLELVGDLLDVHKSEAGELRVTPRAVDLRALLAETATLFAAAAHEKGIELRAGTAPDVPRGARFDPLRLRQVIGNVLSNAVKFTERGEVVLHASLEVDPDGKPSLCVDIHDTGEGIAPDELDRLFEPFRQTSAAAVRRGTGLGLVVVKRLVTLMNGSVDVTSAAGRGTCVLLRLPCIACDPPAAASGDGFESGSSGAPARRCASSRSTIIR